MPRIKNGFKGERTIVLPAFLIEKLKQDPLGQELYITDIGYYPHANFHYCERTAEEVNEFVLIYCVEGQGWFELAHRREMNHSAAFWQIVETYLPDYRERRQWLKENGNRYSGPVELLKR